MALFGKKKNDDSEDVSELQELFDKAAEELENEGGAEQWDGVSGSFTEDDGKGMSLAEDKDEETAPAEERELTPEEAFKGCSAELCHRLRLLFPQQMLVGLYYGELSGGDYVDDFCCYTTRGELIGRDEIPTRCGMSYPDMVAREDKLMQAFFRFRKAAEAYTEKGCSGVTITLLANGQAKMDINSDKLDVEGEDERFDKFRQIVIASDPKNMPPRMTKEQSEAIGQKTAAAYQELGTEFFSFLPEVDFKKAYFYCEIGESGAFFYHRMVLEDGTIIDGDDLYERFEMDKETAEKNRMEIVRLIMKVRQIFIDEKQRPFSTVTLTVTQKGEFRSYMGFANTDPEGEQARLEEWKAAFDGNEKME